MSKEMIMAEIKKAREEAEAIAAARQPICDEFNRRHEAAAKEYCKKQFDKVIAEIEILRDMIDGNEAYLRKIVDDEWEPTYRTEFNILTKLNTHFTEYYN